MAARCSASTSTKQTGLLVDDKGFPLNRRILPTVALAIILCLAAFLRLWNLDAAEFKYDEARVSNLAAHFVDTGVPPVRGMGSSIGIDNPPLTIYLVSLPVLLGRDPLIVTAFVALINVAAVWGCYRLARRYWGIEVALLAAFLLAISPWAVFYSRKVWAQNLLLPWVLSFFGLLLAWLVEDRPWALCGTIVVLAALTQIHFSTLAFIPVLALVILFKIVRLPVRNRHNSRPATPGPASLWKPLAVGLGVSALLYAPYLVFDALVGWRNVRAFLQVMRTPAQTHWEAIRFALLNIGGREIHALAGPQQFRRFLAGIVDLAYWPDRVEEALVMVSILYLAFRWWRGRDEVRAFRRDGVLLLWLIAPVLFYLRSKSEVFPHYLILLYPAPYIALGIAAVDALKAIAKRVRQRQFLYGLGALCLAALAGWQSYLSLSIYAFVETHHTPGGMGTPIRIHREVVRTMERYVEAWENRQVVLLCPGDDPRWDECPSVFGFMTSRSLDLRFVDRDASLLFPQSQADTLIVLAPGESLAAAALPQHTDPLSSESVPLREGVGQYTFYRLAAGYAPNPTVRPAGSPARLENGVSLLGYELSGTLEPAQTPRLALYWRVDDLPLGAPAQGYSFANHLMTADGRRYGQKDGPGHRVDLWRRGDTLISWFDLSLSAEALPKPYTLRVGMYVHTPPDQFITVPVVDAAGRPVGDAVEWAVE